MEEKNKLNEIKRLINEYVNEKDVKEIKVDIFKFYNKKTATIRIDGRSI